jgi:hypothetical protein
LKGLSSVKEFRIFALLLVTCVLLSCGRNTLQRDIPKPLSLTESQLQALATRKIFFGHKSVGMNILQGVSDLAAQDPRIRLRIVTSADPADLPEPALVESEIGSNFNPSSKIEDFVAVLDRGLGKQGGIAVCKLCYVDITPSTDVRQLFDLYCGRINEIRAKYPGVTIVHVTVPLTAEEPALKELAKRALGLPTGHRSDIEQSQNNTVVLAKQKLKELAKRALGRGGSRELNIKRNQYNNLLLAKFSSSDVIFDLAAAESTRPDGSRTFFMWGNEKIYTLAPEFTYDGGHLNELGRRVVAQDFLVALVRANEKQTVVSAAAGGR